ncbi:MAG: hypothetical protein L0H31_01475 [Nocardioidaceae bacterium]|nr:hypothetical protein [Nocardioidaceae bacterium]
MYRSLRRRRRPPCPSLAVLLALTLGLSAWPRRRWGVRDERGDVPGWVLITVMTITIGVGIWRLAEPQLLSILQSALNSVK